MALVYLRRHYTHRFQRTMASLLGGASPTPLTAEFLEANGCEVEGGERVESETALAEAGENGSLARVVLVEPRSGRRRTLIVKRPPASAAALSVAATQQWYAREIFFYSALAGRLRAAPSARAPACHVARLDAATGSFCLVLEDLAASGCAPMGGGAGDLAAGAAALGRIHGAFAGAFDGAAPAVDRGPLPTMPVHVELADYIEAYFAKSWAAVRADARYALPPDAAALVDALAAPGRYAALTRDLGEAPTTLLHGDFRAANLMMADGATVVVYDWQFAAVGNGAYDVAYYIALSCDRDERRLRDGDLRAAYLAALADAAGGEAAPTLDDRDMRKAVLLGLASFVIGAATAGDAPASVATHRSGLDRLSGAALDWGAAAVLPP